MEDDRLCLDEISSLPSPIIESILCLLPIRDAARTSTLSKNWRYKWATIPKLEFIEKDFEVTTYENQLSIRNPRFISPSETKQMSSRRKLFYAIYQVLLVHCGPIHEFTLSTTADDTCVEIDQIILHLSRKYTVKKLKLDITAYRAPLCIFSLHQLTDLYLHNCVFDHDPTTFNGFGSLTTLYVHDVIIFAKTLRYLISSSPLLKSLTLILSDEHLLRCDSTVFDLVECLPVIEHLDISYWVFQWFAYDVVQRELPASLIHLKSLSLKGVSFIAKYELLFLLLLIKSSPNLDKLKLTTYRYLFYEESEIDCVPLKKYSHIWLEHLTELQFEVFNFVKPEMEFVKLILAKSPALKKVSIVLWDKFTKDETLKILRILLHSPHASPLVDIIVECQGRDI